MVTAIIIVVGLLNIFGFMLCYWMLCFFTKDFRRRTPETPLNKKKAALMVLAFLVFGDAFGLLIVLTSHNVLIVITVIMFACTLLNFKNPSMRGKSR